MLQVNERKSILWTLVEPVFVVFLIDALANTMI